MFERLIDHHCHGVSPANLDPPGFSALMSEAHKPHSAFFGSQFDKPLGLAIRRWCAPVLGLEAFASPQDYVARRQALGAEEANRRLLRAAGVTAMLIDTGHRAGDILDCAGMAAASGVPCPEVVRIEAVMEAHADAGGPVDSYPDRLAERAEKAVGLKSIVAYRAAFDLDPARPGSAEVRSAWSRWLEKRATTGPRRLEDPVLLRFALWCALDLAAPAALPLQLHVGFGDRDIFMQRCDPTIFTPFIAEAEEAGVPITLLHCYPFEREAGWLAEVYSNVFLDVGAVLNFTGPSAIRVLSDAMEMAPFSKLLYSSDAFGLAELHHLGRLQFETALRTILDRWVAGGSATRADADHIAGLIAFGNAERIYRRF
ncbi:MAG: amidohydrolase family protein [Pseudomonadota bacterium]